MSGIGFHVFQWMNTIGLVAWCSGNVFYSINKVAIHWAGLVLGWVLGCLGADKAFWYVTSCLGQLSLLSLWGR